MSRTKFRATVNNSNNDGWVYATSNTSWADVHNATTGDATSNVTRNDKAAATYYTAGTIGRGGTPASWTIYRSFYTIDTSHITAKPNSAKVLIYGYNTTSPQGDIILLKSNHSTPLADGDFNAIVGWETEFNIDGADTDLISYSDEVSSWNTNAYNSITLTDAALSDIYKTNEFKFCMVNYDHDAKNSTPGGAGFLSIHGKYNGGWYNNATNNSLRPFIEVTHPKMARREKAKEFAAHDKYPTAVSLASSKNGSSYDINIKDKNGTTITGGSQIKFKGNHILGTGGDGAHWQLYPSASSDNSEGDEFTMVNDTNGWIFKFNKVKWQNLPSASGIEINE